MNIQGTYNTAVVFNDNVDQVSRDQIREFCNQEIFMDARIRIMPDVHAGMGCVIGYTANLGDKVVPNLIGLDIGCGILATNLGRLNLSFDKLDTSEMTSSMTFMTAGTSFLSSGFSPRTFPRTAFGLASPKSRAFFRAYFSIISLINE